jgi:hypothetical protein
MLIRLIGNFKIMKNIIPLDAMVLKLILSAVVEKVTFLEVKIGVFLTHDKMQSLLFIVVINRILIH